MQVCCIVSLGMKASLDAEDASIDKLLSKLPPPEKYIQPSARRPGATRPCIQGLVGLANSS